MRKKEVYKCYIKRVLDLSLSGLGLICLSPVFCVVALLVRFKLGKPIIFIQERPGMNEKTFRLYKFRTMTEERDADGILLPDENRLTSFGRFLRSTSLDELPELVNILKGEMSFVGPRPLLISYLPYYTERERIRHSVRPGLTGLAQVNGRNYLEWDKRLELDAYYVENIKFLTDMKIIMRTVEVVFKRKDIEIDSDKAEGNFAELRKRECTELLKKNVEKM